MKKVIFAILIATAAMCANAQCPTVKYSVSETHEVYGNVLNVQTQSVTLPTAIPYGTPYIQYALKMNTDPYTQYIKLNAFDSLVSGNVPVSWNIGTADTLVVSAELIYMAYDSNGVLQVTNAFVPCIQEDTIIVQSTNTGLIETNESYKTKIYAYEKQITIESEKLVKNCTVYDITGRVVINEQTNDNTVKVQTTLPSGIYIVLATFEDGSQKSTKVPIQ